MPGPLAYPEAAHFAQDLALGVEVGVVGDPYPRHPRGQQQPAGNGELKCRVLRSQLFRYRVPNGSDQRFPLPRAGERLYLARWYPGDIFAGLSIFGAEFTGSGNLEARYRNVAGKLQRLTLARAVEAGKSQGFALSVTELVNEVNPAAHVLDVYLALHSAPQAGDWLRGRLDFLSS